MYWKYRSNTLESMDIDEMNERRHCTRARVSEEAPRDLGPHMVAVSINLDPKSVGNRRLGGCFPVGCVNNEGSLLRLSHFIRREVFIHT